MLAADVILSARRRYNATADTFFTDAALFTYLQDAERELSTEVPCIEATDATTLSVNGTDTYAYPTDFLDIRSVRYNGGKPLEVQTQRQIEDRYPQDGAVQTGTPRYYAIYDDEIILWPVPDTDALGITVTGHKISTALSLSPTVLSIPVRYHHGLFFYILAAMFTQDQNDGMADRYDAKWEAFKAKCRRIEAKRKRGQGPARVNQAYNMRTDDYCS